MYNCKVEIKGVDTAKLPTLSDTEKKELLQKAKNGDDNARERLIFGNLRLVLSIIARFTSRGENPDDMFQIGCIGLIKAIDNFNTELDVKFSTYAVPMIIGELRRYLRDNNMIRVSRSVRDTAYHALNAKEILSKKMNTEPTIKQITEFMCANGDETTPEKVASALEAIIEPVSLFEPIYNEQSTDCMYIFDKITDQNSTDEIWLDNISLKEAITKLPKKEKRILNLRYYEGKTQMEISDELGISQAQVSRIEKSAIGEIRKNFY